MPGVAPRRDEPTLPGVGPGGPTLLEVGPGVVGRLGGSDRPVTPMERSALQGIDDPVVLLDGRPVGTAELWRTLIGSVPGLGAGPLVVVHPSWWPPRRVDRIVGCAAAAAGPAGRPVAAMTRAEVIRRSAAGEGAVVVEVGSDAVAVSAGGGLRLLGCADVGAVVDAVGHLVAGDAAVVVEAACGVPGAGRVATEITEALRHAGLRARRADLGSVAAHTAPRRRGRRRWPAAAALAAGLIGALAVAAAVRQPGPAPSAGPPEEGAGPGWTSLVEGRIAVEIPTDWSVRRVTSGPGSRRVEVSSPADPDAVLHVTGSYAPGTTLADAAEVLGRAVAAQPAGVFTEFRAADRVGGRPAVTYRESRPGRTVEWVVVLDGATRISVGCQRTAPEVCVAAVTSARELTPR